MEVFLKYVEASIVLVIISFVGLIVWLRDTYHKTNANTKAIDTHEIANEKALEEQKKINERLLGKIEEMEKSNNSSRESIKDQLNNFEKSAKEDNRHLEDKMSRMLSEDRSATDNKIERIVEKIDSQNGHIADMKNLLVKIESRYYPNRQD